MLAIRPCLAILLIATAVSADEPRPSVDRHGDPLPNGAVARFGTNRLRHRGMDGEDDTFAFRPDGKAVATWNEQTVRLWDVADGKRLWEFATQSETLAAAFSPDGKRLALCTGAGVLVVDATTGRAERTLVKALRTAVAFSPDSRTVAVGNRERARPVEVWDAATGKRTAEFVIAAAEVGALGFSADGKTLRVAYSRPGNGWPNVCVANWDMTANKRGPVFDPDVRLHTYKLSDDGRWLASREMASDGIRLWDTTAVAKSAGEIPIGYANFTFGPGARTVVTANNERPPRRLTRIAVWDAKTCKMLHEFAVPREMGESAQLSPDGKLVAIPRRGEMLSLWDPQTGEQRLPAAGHNTQVVGLAFADGGAVLVSTSTAGDVRVWDTATAAQTAVVPRELRPFAVLPGGRELLADKGRVQRYDLTTGRPVGEPFAPPGLTGLLAGDAFRSASLTLSADGRSVTGRGSVRGPGRKTPLRYEVIWDVKAGRPTAERALADLPKVDSVTTGGRTAVEYENRVRPAPAELAKAGFPSSWTTDLRAFDGATGRLLMTVRIPDEFNFHYGVSPDGQTVAVVSYKRGAAPALPPSAMGVSLWEVRTGRERAVIPINVPRHYDPHTLAFSPDGRLLALSRDSYRVEVIDLATGRELVVRGGFEGTSYKLAFRADGRRLASGHTDGTILLWDIPAPPTQAATPEALEAAWKDLASEDAGRAYAATWTLASSPTAAVTLLAGRLKPADAGVIDRVRAKITDLDSKSFQAREAAAAELARLAGTADAVLRDALREIGRASCRERV